METGSVIRNRRILLRALLVILAAGMICGVIFIIKCAGDNKYVYPEFKKKVASLEELKLGVKDIPELMFPGLDLLDLNPASEEYYIGMSSPKRTAKPSGYYISGSSAQADGAGYSLQAFLGDLGTEERGDLFFGGVWMKQYHEDRDDFREERIEADINGCSYIFSAAFDRGHALTAEEAEETRLKLFGNLFKLMQDIILQQSATVLPGPAYR